MDLAGIWLLPGALVQTRSGGSGRIGGLNFSRHERSGKQGFNGCLITQRRLNGEVPRIALLAHEPERIKKVDPSFEVNIQGGNSPCARRQLCLSNFVNSSFV